MSIRKINDNGINLVKSFEGIRDGDKITPNYDPYLDPVGIWTIGYGHAIKGGKDFLRGEQNRQTAKNAYPNGLTLQQCEDLLRIDLESKCKGVESLLLVNVSDNQFAALVSLAYNIGIGAFGGSTILKLINLGKFKEASEHFIDWNKATVNGQKVILAGLTRRRLAEKELFLKV